MNEQLIAQLQLLIELAETGEEFEIVKSVEFDYRFKNNKLQSCIKNDCSDWEWANTNLSFNYAITDIKCQPWKPKRRETYWYWWNDNQNKATLSVSTRHDGMYADYMSMLVGNCFRTKEECESHTEVRDKLIAMRKEYE